jgi:hypothetical protein
LVRLATNTDNSPYGLKVTAALFFVLLYAATAFAVFWIIRLAVRHGVDDALKKNRGWLEHRH